MGFMKVLLDSNVWRYVADHSDGAELASRSAEFGTEIVVAPSLVFEARALKDDTMRKKILELLSLPSWRRLMPETFLEAEEIKNIVRRLRPEWLVPHPDLSEVNRLRLDWERAHGGFWSNARDDISPPRTDESLRGEQEHALARQEAENVRLRVLGRKQQLSVLSFVHVYGVPPDKAPGWRGEPVEYWRVPSLYHIQNELAVYTSPYREWLDSEINVVAIVAEPESLTRLWYYEIVPVDARRQWIRGAYEYLQAFHKVTPGNPADSQLSSHLVDVDAIVSADRNFVRFTQKCLDDAPFPLAQPYLIPGGANAVVELLAFLREFRTMAPQSQRPIS
jgi:hypothetical protein